MEVNYYNVAHQAHIQLYVHNQHRGTTKAIRHERLIAMIVKLKNIAEIFLSRAARWL